MAAAESQPHHEKLLPYPVYRHVEREAWCRIKGCSTQESPDKLLNMLTEPEARMNHQAFHDAEMMPLLIQKLLSLVPDSPLDGNLVPRLSGRGSIITEPRNVNVKARARILLSKPSDSLQKTISKKQRTHDEVDYNSEKTMTNSSEGLPSHASPQLAPLHSPIPRPSAHFLHNLNWNDTDRSSGASTPGIPENLISPAFTPPLTPGTPSTIHDDPLQRHLNAEPKSTPVDTSKDDPATTKQPKLVERLPKVECVVRARIPTTSGAEMFLHLYTNDADNKEHLAIVFGNSIRSRSLDAEKPGETERDRMIRGAYIGRLRPGRISSRVDDILTSERRLPHSRTKSGSALRIVTSAQETSVAESSLPNTASTSASNPQTQAQSTTVQDEDEAIPYATPSSAEAQPPTSEDAHDKVHVHSQHCKAPLVRIHSECYTGETAWSARCDCGEQLDEAARLMSLPSSLHPGGVIVYLRQEGRGIGLASKLKAYNLQDLGHDTVEANLLLRHPADARSYGLATAILVDLGLGTDLDEQKNQNEQGIRLLTNNPDKVRAVEGPGREIRVVERVAMVPLAWSSKGNRGIKGAEIEKYLETKIGRMGHMLER